MFSSLTKNFDDESGKETYSSLKKYQIKYEANTTKPFPQTRKPMRFVSTVADKENYLNIRIRFSTGPAHHRRMKPIKSEYTIATFIALHCKSDQDVSDLCGKVNQSTKMPVLKNQFRVKNTNFIFQK